MTPESYDNRNAVVSEDVHINEEDHLNNYERWRAANNNNKHRAPLTSLLHHKQHQINTSMSPPSTQDVIGTDRQALRIEDVERQVVGSGGGGLRFEDVESMRQSISNGFVQIDVPGKCKQQKQQQQITTTKSHHDEVFLDEQKTATQVSQKVML